MTGRFFGARWLATKKGPWGRCESFNQGKRVSAGETLKKHHVEVFSYEAFKVPIRVGELFGYTERRIRYDSWNVT